MLFYLRLLKFIFTEMKDSISVSTGNFIKVIYRLEHSEGSDTRPGSIARELGITNAAATDMSRKLAEKKLVKYEKYKKLGLTAAGEKMALAILRKHRLWETLFHRLFDMSMHEIHREAEMLEHFTSDFLAEKISTYLGHPDTDPHGDPIPSERGKVPPDKQSIFLSMAEPDRVYTISRLSGTDKEFFDFCHSNHLDVGLSLTVKKQYVMNRMTEIEINDARILLSSDLANTIYVKEQKKQ